MTFQPSELSDLLIAAARGDYTLAGEIVQKSDNLGEALRAKLIDTLQAGGTPGDVLSAIADNFRISGESNRADVNQIHRAAFYAGDQWADLARNPLFAYFQAARSALGLDKWIQYFDVYDRHLSRFRGTEATVLEIGTFKGGGLAMLQDYLGPRARLVGMDIDPLAIVTIEDRFNAVLGDQEDPASLVAISEKYGPFDVIIDDGGHTMNQQIISAETLFPLLNGGGVYLSEDLHTSYWSEFGGGLGREGTFIEWIKCRIDDINGYHAGTDETGLYGTTDYVNNWTRSIGGLHVYDSIVVIDKKRVQPPFCELSGTFHHLRETRGGETLVINLVQAREAALRDAALRDAALRDAAESHAENMAAIEILQAKAAKARDQASRAKAETAAMKRSKSWKLTKPLRRKKP